ncbi:hypothetical protein HDK64DRAFT_249873 [Phyllosticta capitalensis]
MPSIPAKAPILANQNMDSSTLLKILSSLSKIIDLLAKKDSWSTEAIIGLVAVFVSVAIALIGYFRGLDCFKRNLSKLCDLSAILWNKTLVRRNKKAKKPGDSISNVANFIQSESNFCMSNRDAGLKSN